MAPTKPHRTQFLLFSLLIVCLLFAACASSGGKLAVSTPSATPTATIPAKWRGTGVGVPAVTPPASLSPRPLPAFSDPRVAYIGPDSLLHVVSLDGKRELMGTPIPLSGLLMVSGVWAAGTSPDGKQLAYFENAQVTTIDAASGARKKSPILDIGDSTVSWTPDQRYLALRHYGAIECVNVATGSSFVTPGDPLAANSRPLVEGPYGWLDATHVAVAVLPNTSGTPGTHAIPPTPIPGSPETYATLASLDITTNQLRPIASVQKGGSVGAFSVLPGGQWSLFTNIEQQGQSYTPQVALINNTTGAVTPLRHLSSLLPPRGFNSIVWRPNSTQAIVDTGFPQTRDDHYLLIDALHDTATPISLPGFPEMWSPDGSTLVVSNGPEALNLDGIGWENVGEVGAGPFTLQAVRIGWNGSTSAPVTLTTRAMNIPMLGFVHTA
ncbi:MAG TPA: hypothetical protein VFU63_11590 [Ktedonobacterales bacterium]|nr:hypothetical protein [Ktedonobacterales bacterium]